MYRNLLIFIVASLLWAGCMPGPFYQKSETIPQNAWSYDFKPTFKVDITDTTRAYNIYLLIRHTEAYPYANIWLWLYVKAPHDSTFHKSRVNIPLAERSGKWMGRGMGEIWEQVLYINYDDPSIFSRKGTYELKLEQNMRVNPLPEILQAGLRIEKAGPRNFKGQH